MNLVSECKNLIEILEKIKENIGLNKSTAVQNIFHSLNVRKASDNSDYGKDPKHIFTNKTKKYYFRITYLKGTIQFLDIKSILSLSLVNKEFNYFIKSIYFYKFMSNVKNSKKKKIKQTKIEEKVNLTQNKLKKTGIMGNFVGVLGSVFGKMKIFI